MPPSDARQRWDKQWLEWRLRDFCKWKSQPSTVTSLWCCPWLSFWNDKVILVMMTPRPPGFHCSVSRSWWCLNLLSSAATQFHRWVNLEGSEMHWVSGLEGFPNPLQVFCIVPWRKIGKTMRESGHSSIHESCAQKTFQGGLTLSMVQWWLSFQHILFDETHSSSNRL